MGEIKLLGFVCDRCNHKWFPRSNSEHKPLVCPQCKSPYWNTPRKNIKRNNHVHELFPNSIVGGKNG